MTDHVRGIHHVTAIATDSPGFTRDESLADLGTDLKLPGWLEDDRERIERELADTETPEIPEVS